MALSVKPYFFPERWMVMGDRSTLTAGQKSRLGDESRDEGLEEKECGDMGLASGEKPPCCSTGCRQIVKHSFIKPQTDSKKSVSFLASHLTV